MSERPDQPVEEEMAIPEGGGEDHMDLSCQEESDAPGYVSLKSKGPRKPINIGDDEKLHSFSRGIQAISARSLSVRDHDQISDFQAEFKDQSAEFLDKSTGQSAHYNITKSIVECNEDMNERPEQAVEEEMAIPEGDATHGSSQDYDENAVGVPKPDLPTVCKSKHSAKAQVNEVTGTRGNEAARKLENFMRKAETELCIDKTRVTERKPTRPEPLTNEKVIEKSDTESKSDSEYIANLEREIELLQRPRELDRQVEERKKLEEDKKKKEEEKRKIEIEVKKLEDKKKLDENRKKKEEYRKRKEEEDKKKREDENKKMEEERMRREKEEADKREKEEADKKEKEEAERKKKEETDKKLKEEAERKKKKTEKKLREESEKKKKDEAEKKMKEEAERKKKKDAEKKMKEEGDKKNKEDSNKKKEESDKKKKEESRKKSRERKNDKVDKEKKNLSEKERKLEEEIEIDINNESRDRILKKVENKNRKRKLIAERIDRETVDDDNVEYEIVTIIKKFKKTGN